MIETLTKISSNIISKQIPTESKSASHFSFLLLLKSRLASMHVFGVNFPAQNPCSYVDQYCYELQSNRNSEKYVSEHI